MLWALFTERRPLLVGLLLGLSITTHLTSILMLPLCIYTLRRRDWHKLALGTVVGLSPLLLLYFFAAGDSPVIWGKPDGLREWLWLVSGWLYKPNMLSLPQAAWLERFYSWLLPFFIPLIIMATVIVVRFAGNHRISGRPGPMPPLLTAAVYSIYAFSYATPDAIVLLVPAVILLILILAVNIGNSRLGYPLLIFIVVLGSVYLISERQEAIRPEMEKALSQIPEGSIVVTPGDQTIAATWYFAYAEDQRSDLIVVDYNLFQFDWYRDHLSELFPGLKALESDAFNVFVEVNLKKYPVCELTLHETAELDCSAIYHY
jgi:hypothetical protein